MAEVSVGAFGPVSARVAGAAVDLGGPRQRAVLGLLVAAGRQVVSTDRFLDDLWSGEPPPKALGALQVYVSHLRRLLEPARRPRQPATTLVSAAPGYVLDLPDDAVDTWRYTALSRAARGAEDPEEVVRLVDLAEGLWTDQPFTAYADEPWAREEADRLRDLRAGGTELRAAALLELGRTGRVVGDLEDLVRRHPLRERAVELLALALYRSGRQVDALAVLRRVRGRLAEELGVDPGPALRALERDVLDHAPRLQGAPEPRRSARDATASAGQPPAGRPPARPPAGDDELVGRDDVLRRLHAAASARGRPALVWVEGEAGAGKSTLLERFADEVAERAQVASGRCSEVSGAPPAWAWHDVVVAMTGGPPPVDASGLTVVLSRALAERDGGDPVVVVLEDLHRADQETLQVLRHLVGAARGPLLVVGSFRGDEVGHDLALTLAATAPRTVDRIVLAGLDDDAARRLLRRQVGRDLPDPVWHRLVERGAGNALFLRQLGQLVASEGPGVAATELPLAIRDLIDRRVERLPARTVATLARASVLGRDVDLDLLLAAPAVRGRGTEDEVVDDLDAGVVAGLLHAPGPGLLRFTHVLVRDALYDRLPPLRRERLHLAVLAALEHRDPGRTYALAHHAAQSLGAATAGRSLGHLVEGARRAQGAGAADDAATAWRAVLRAHDLGAGTAASRLEAHRELVRCLAGSGDLVSARAEREVSVAAAERSGTVADVARAWLWDPPSLWATRPFADRAHEEVGRITALLDRLDPAERHLRARTRPSRGGWTSRAPARRRPSRSPGSSATRGCCARR